MSLLKDRAPIIRELSTIWLAILKHMGWQTPKRLIWARLTDSGLPGASDKLRFAELIGDGLLDLLNDLGPIYGKIVQTLLSRLPQRAAAIASALRLERVYGDWPPIGLGEIEAILDEQLPNWRDEGLVIDPEPLGVASMAQVHAAKDHQGKQWVLKLIKPKARERMLGSLAAFARVIAAGERLALSAASKRVIEELKYLHRSLELEVDLQVERESLQKAATQLVDRAAVLRIPKVHPTLTAPGLLVCERFYGVRLSDIIAGKTSISDGQRRALAKQVLQELLVQVFELGLFHADPHAGNLMLLDDGSVGLFDWGLTGELSERDRHYIAAMLRAIMAMDLQRLASVLAEMAADAGRDVPIKAITAEMNKLKDKLAKQHAKGQKLNLRELIQLSLNAAARLRIPMPQNLVLMAKTLVTIEGLATGIDKNISLKLVAAPVLWRVAKPTWKDMWAMSTKLWTLRSNPDSKKK